MKFFYFPNSKNLNDHWFHRLIFPLYKVCIILYIIGFGGYFLIKTVPFIYEYTRAITSNSTSLSWCSDYLDNLKKKETNESLEQFYSNLNDVQKSLLLSLPIEKSRGYAAKLGGCIFRNTENEIRAWASDKDSKLYFIQLYVGTPLNIFKGYLVVTGIDIIGYVFGSLVPGIVYKYILFVVYGKKLNKLLSKKI